MEMHTLSATDLQSGYFKTFVQNLVEKFQPSQLICFAKTKQLTETTGCFKDQQSSHNCNYCLLMVTGTSTRIDHEVQEYSNFHYRHGRIAIICHSQEAVLEAIKANNRFFMTAYTNGLDLLYLSRHRVKRFTYLNRNYVTTEKSIPEGVQAYER